MKSLFRFWCASKVITRDSNLLSIGGINYLGYEVIVHYAHRTRLNVSCVCLCCCVHSLCHVNFLAVENTLWKTFCIRGEFVINLLKSALFVYCVRFM
jgi:hypothetical protein